MIFEIFIGFIALIVAFIILGFSFDNWYFSVSASLVTLIFTILLWNAYGIEYHTGNTIYTNYTADANDVINSSAEQVNFNYEEVQGFNIDLFALFTLLTSILLFMTGLMQKKET